MDWRWWRWILWRRIRFITLGRRRWIFIYWWSYIGYNNQWSSTRKWQDYYLMAGCCTAVSFADIWSSVRLGVTNLYDYKYLPGYRCIWSNKFMQLYCNCI